MTINENRKRKFARLADVIALCHGKIVLVERLREPFGLALPGGHVDPGETPKEAAIREFTEETGLALNGAKFLTKRKGHRRDPRYTFSETRVYTGKATGIVRNEKGFTRVLLMNPKKVCALPKERFVFDHASILRKYFENL